MTCRTCRVAIVLLSLRLAAQAPKFELASIRVSEREDIPSFGPGLRDGILTATRATLRRLLSRSYELTDPQVIGPEWLDTMRFDIIAKSPEGVPDSAMAAMLRALVKERFRLAAHLETRTAPVYHLAVAPGGVKMPLYPERNPLESDPAARGSGTMGGAGTPAQIANILSSILGRPVIDKTGLTDRYRYFAYFAPYPPRPDTNLPEFRPPDIFTAIQKQMGLELRSAKDAISVLVVDHMERLPTPN
jgi:uncharacterized protein (TIGR03435 family)